ncbi:hypothetical protein C7I87_32630 [Mesorhizobium sp. SARCC-RB16n]|nr:hypothetical protein C7I87_32630 [Mesorhizobium sp. SARCC-RB16n]
MQAEDPQGICAWSSDPDAAPQGGESLADVARRTARLMERLVAERGHTIAVTYAAIIRAAVIQVLGAAPMLSASGMMAIPRSHPYRQQSQLYPPSCEEPWAGPPASVVQRTLPNASRGPAAACAPIQAPPSSAWKMSIRAAAIAADVGHCLQGILIRLAPVKGRTMAAPTPATRPRACQTRHGDVDCPIPWMLLARPRF